jgi:hypothetical protein
MFGRPTGSLMPPWQGLVARAFMETPEGRSLYERQLGMLFTNVYHTTALADRVNELAARIRPVVAERNSQAVLEYDRRVAELRRRIVLRGEFVKQQLAATNWQSAPRETGRRLSESLP